LQSWAIEARSVGALHLALRVCGRRGGQVRVCALMFPGEKKKKIPRDPPPPSENVRRTAFTILTAFPRSCSPPARRSPNGPTSRCDYRRLCAGGANDAHRRVFADHSARPSASSSSSETHRRRRTVGTDTVSRAAPPANAADRAWPCMCWRRPETKNGRWPRSRTSRTSPIWADRPNVVVEHPSLGAGSFQGAAGAEHISRRNPIVFSRGRLGRQNGRHMCRQGE